MTTISIPNDLFQEIKGISKGRTVEQYVIRMLLRMIKYQKRIKCIECGQETYEDYMVHRRVWTEVVSPKGGLLHLACLQKRLGRKLSPEDFPDLPINAGLHLGVEMGKKHG